LHAKNAAKEAAKAAKAKATAEAAKVAPFRPVCSALEWDQGRARKCSAPVAAAAAMAPADADSDEDSNRDATGAASTATAATAAAVRPPPMLQVLGPAGTLGGGGSSGGSSGDGGNSGDDAELARRRGQFLTEGLCCLPGALTALQAAAAADAATACVESAGTRAQRLHIAKLLAPISFVFSLTSIDCIVELVLTMPPNLKHVSSA